MMTCKELIEFLIDYHEGTLEPAARQEFDRHLAHCPACRHYLDSYVKTIELARDAASESDCEQLPDALVHAIVRAATIHPPSPI